jgi:hypothetical protein
VTAETKIEALLSQYPKPVALYSWRPRLLLILGILFLVGCSWAAWTTQLPAGDLYRYMPVRRVNPVLLQWMLIVFFMSLATFMALLALPGSEKLVLDANGFKRRALLRRQTYNWSDTSYFRVVDSLVWFSHTTANRASEELNFQETYGLSTNALAALMRQWRERALAAT